MPIIVGGRRWGALQSFRRRVAPPNVGSLGRLSAPPMSVPLGA